MTVDELRAALAEIPGNAEVLVHSFQMAAYVPAEEVNALLIWDKREGYGETLYRFHALDPVRAPEAVVIL